MVTPRTTNHGDLKNVIKQFSQPVPLQENQQFNRIDLNCDEPGKHACRNVFLQNNDESTIDR